MVCLGLLSYWLWSALGALRLLPAAKGVDFAIGIVSLLMISQYYGEWAIETRPTWFSQATHSLWVQVSGSAGEWWAQFQSIVKRPKDAASDQVQRECNSPPVGSALGNRSWPQIVHAATPAIMAAKAKKGPWLDQPWFSSVRSEHTMYSKFEGIHKSPTRWFAARSSGVGILREELYKRLQASRRTR